MTTCYTVTEHSFLFRGDGPAPPVGVRIPAADFDALRALIVDVDLEDPSEDVLCSRVFRLRSVGRELALQIRNYVGVIETPSGLQIEILPKTGGDLNSARETLVRMLRVATRIPPIAVHRAALRPQRLPLIDFFASEFLKSVTGLIKRGLLSGYDRVQQNGRYLKGRLLVGENVRHNCVRADRFYVEHDQFQLNRAENRLIRAALELLVPISTEPANQRLGRELLFALDDVPASADIAADFQRCVSDRSSTHYSDALEWARLILLGLRPMSSNGKSRVRSLLFPMERIFEECVGAGLRRQCRHWARVRAQSQSKSLVKHNGDQYFQLRPDYLVEIGGTPKVVVDAKWKLIDSKKSGADKKYGLAQADLYQLYAYGNKYLGQEGSKTVVLVYPKTDLFLEPLAVFEYEPDHNLHVMPFDLERCEIVGFAQITGPASTNSLAEVF